MTDYIDHGTDVSDTVVVYVYKDGWIASKPWHADLVFADGQVWKGWQSFFRSRKALIQNALAAAPRARVVDGIAS